MVLSRKRAESWPAWRNLPCSVSLMMVGIVSRLLMKLLTPVRTNARRHFHVALGDGLGDGAVERVVEFEGWRLNRSRGRAGRACPEGSSGAAGQQRRPAVTAPKLFIAKLYQPGSDPVRGAIADRSGLLLFLRSCAACGRENSTSRTSSRRAWKRPRCTAVMLGAASAISSCAHRQAAGCQWRCGTRSCNRPRRPCRRRCWPPGREADLLGRRRDIVEQVEQHRMRRLGLAGLQQASA